MLTLLGAGSGSAGGVPAGAFLDEDAEGGLPFVDEDAEGGGTFVDEDNP